MIDPYDYHMMIDLETLSTKPNACILSIGAVIFQFSSTRIVDEFYINVDCNNLQDKFDIDLDTILWWFKQEDNARSSVMKDRRSIDSALAHFNYFYNYSNEYLKARDPVIKSIWSYGSGFDIPILEHTFRVANFGKPPWKYKQVKDLRTLLDIANINVDDFKEDSSMLHNALYDCKIQVKAAVAAYNKLFATKPNKAVHELNDQEKWANAVWNLYGYKIGSKNNQEEVEKALREIFEILDKNEDVEILVNSCGEISDGEISNT